MTRSGLAILLAGCCWIPVGAVGRPASAPLPMAAGARAASADPGISEAQARARQTVAAMRPEELTVLTNGIMPLPIISKITMPPGAIFGAGFVPGIPRLGIPALTESDAELGVSWTAGLRHDGATALPSGMAMGATWNPELIRRAGAMIGTEARAKGFNVLLAGAVNLVRDPRGGRTFEYLSEDPLLSGTIGGSAIDGIQSVGVLSTIKHLAINSQETARKTVDARIDEAAARESDLLAFQIGIERGRPGAVMCAYNRVNGVDACDSDWLMNRVLKQDWRYPGFVMSDWGTVSRSSSVLRGLDQQSGAQLDKAVFLGTPLAQLAAGDPAYASRLEDMNRRILTSIYAVGLDRAPARPGGHFDKEADSAIAREVAAQAIVLLRNSRGILPLAAGARRIAVVGGYADSGVLSGAGSSQVHDESGPAIIRPKGGEGAFAAAVSEQYQPSPPLRAIKALAPDAVVTFADGRYVSDAVTQARQADVAIVFATQWMAEGFDQPDLSLPFGQDMLIAAVAAANPNTIVVLETGGPVAMPWLDQTAAVVEAWYPGARGGDAIADVLFGRVNPSGRLPVTFPRGPEQLPRKAIDGFDIYGDEARDRAHVTVNYNIEGADVGYRWNARRGQKALYAFGHGLSYTSFAASRLTLHGEKATFQVSNTGRRDGATVAQLYLMSRAGKPSLRLVGYTRVALRAGASGPASITIDPRLLADWADGSWSIPAGEYRFALGDSAEALGRTVSLHVAARRWKD